MRRRVAYFSMEIGLENGLPTYSGGLGVLAGDTIRAAADLEVRMVAVTLVHREGYFRQRLDEEGNQTEEPFTWNPEERLPQEKAKITLQLEGRPIRVRAFRYDVQGYTGHHVPVYLLDTDLPENAAQDRGITRQLYGGDERQRLRQEAVLGLGGVAMLRALGHTGIDVHHMNEGHSALLGLALLERESTPTPEAIQAVRRQCVFTTHTPVPAGHDRFPLELVRQVLGTSRAETVCEAQGCDDDHLNMTRLALNLSRFLNGVAMRHRDVSLDMFPGFPIGSITNGVHARTWTSAPFQTLFDRYIPEWRGETFNLRYAVKIPLDEIRAAHADAKQALFGEIEERTGARLDPEALTVGFARRATPYKRAALVFSDLDRLRRIARDAGPLQFVFAGKAHPRDEGGKDLIRRVFQAARELEGDVRVLWLAGYDMELAAKLVAGTDVWLNTPRRPQEASGTSGMKAALNGVPSLSVLDGWWIEGHIEGITGWSIGSSWEEEGKGDGNGTGGGDAADLYDKLENAVLPLFHGRPDEWAAVMRTAISVNGSFFNTERMMLQYVTSAYGLPAAMAIP